MSDLRLELVNYLALRRSLGFKLERTGQLLDLFVGSLEAEGAEKITTELALAWATLPTDSDPSWHGARLLAVRGFAKYLATIDPESEVPPPDLLPARSRRAVPFLYSEADVTALMTRARSLRSPLRAATYETLIGLLWTTGMRVGEAISLERCDVELDEALLVVRHAKFDKSREVPVHRSTAAALRRYATLRDRHCPRPSSPSFFVSTTGTRLIYKNVHFVFHELVKDVSLVSTSPRCRARIHDLRHSFAIRAMTAIEGGDDAELARTRLSAYLGHFDVASTYWYLEATPELLGTAAARLEVWIRSSS